MLLIGFGWFTAASALCGVAPWLWLLIAARALQAVGATALMAFTLALVGETVPFMGAVFAHTVSTSGVTAASPGAVATGCAPPLRSRRC